VGLKHGNVYWMVLAKLAITLEKEIKVEIKWGKPPKKTKTYLKKIFLFLNTTEPPIW
jgi:hypothetical protein